MDLASLSGERIIIRLDLNVPIQDGVITDTNRIKAALPTIKLLLKRNSVILLTHLGRPNGIEKRYSVRPLVPLLESFLKRPVQFSPSLTTQRAIRLAKNLEPGEILLMENIRFDQGEEGNDPAFAQSLAQLGTCYVNDAFSASHRAHASIVGIPKHLPAYAGLRFSEEISALTKLHTPKRPYVAIIGGAKISTKLKLLKRLLEEADHVYVGGAMMFTLLKAKGYIVGKSMVEDSQLRAAQRIITHPKLVLPIDVLCSTSVSSNAKAYTRTIESIQENDIGLDIGPASIEQLATLCKSAKTIIWNGPLGLFELNAFSKGTVQTARMLASSPAYTVVGGGDSLAALSKARVMRKISYVSTAGGAMLEYIQDGTLPGIKALKI